MSLTLPESDTGPLARLQITPEVYFVARSMRLPPDTMEGTNAQVVRTKAAEMSEAERVFAHLLGTLYAKADEAIPMRPTEAGESPTERDRRIRKARLEMVLNDLYRSDMGPIGTEICRAKAKVDYSP